MEADTYIGISAKSRWKRDKPVLYRRSTIIMSSLLFLVVTEKEIKK